MQNGSLIQSTRRNGQSVWEFRWRDRSSQKVVYRRIVLGKTEAISTATAARAIVAGLTLEINNNDCRLQPHLLTLAQLAEHYTRRELSADNLWKTYSTKAAYAIYLNRWVVPKWGEYQLGRIIDPALSRCYAAA
jgi:hypothetical protein